MRKPLFPTTSFCVVLCRKWAWCFFFVIVVGCRKQQVLFSSSSKFGLDDKRIGWSPWEAKSNGLAKWGWTLRTINFPFILFNRWLPECWKEDWRDVFWPFLGWPNLIHILWWDEQQKIGIWVRSIRCAASMNGYAIACWSLKSPAYVEAQERTLDLPALTHSSSSFRFFFPSPLNLFSNHLPPKVSICHSFLFFLVGFRVGSRAWVDEESRASLLLFYHLRQNAAASALFRLDWRTENIRDLMATYFPYLAYLLLVLLRWD